MQQNTAFWLHVRNEKAYFVIRCKTGISQSIINVNYTGWNTELEYMKVR
jgi:hypothetical protein